MAEIRNMQKVVATGAWDEVAQIPGFKAAGVFDFEGLLLEGKSSPGFPIDDAAATFVMLMLEANKVGNFMKLGDASEVQLIYNGILVILRPVQRHGTKLILGLAVDSSVPLGQIRLRMSQLEKNLSASRVK